MKIERGKVKYEYNNTFNIRINNFTNGGKAQGTFASLDTFVNSLHAQEEQVRREQLNKTHQMKAEAMDIK